MLAADGPSAQLYDPYSGTLSGTTVTRTPYANNKIPSNQLSPIAQSYLQFYPLPNITAVRPDGYQNFGSSATTNDDYNNQLGRVDYNMSDKSRMYFNIRRSGYSQSKNNYFGNQAEGSLLYRNNWGGTLDEVYTINSSNVIDIRSNNFTRMAEIHAAPQPGFRTLASAGPARLPGVQFHVPADADHRLQQQFEFPGIVRDWRQLPAFVIGSALRHLHEDQGQTTS